ncbi:hypothetical protein A3715_34550 [Oleiphilus sp. HI0009]|uniref:GspH/FimT family pseudopilin n=2 Tax=Oleiphilus TaxID=141450 RepID=UPI0007C39354|nr:MULTISPECIES: GspH/FimT family pseudopilin [unclassified Oleiphilus]KZX79063.1 hypothetical protein A3715_09600 [Oleiphilus sp. HI0009]MCH2158908.1 GspH/FimT family pseudopilin [Oleiphilaceae bacterium]KZX81923.1 hypothetical protein A3715_34550 [Oleiphilus sp. HI0009]KZY66418.1 hypothetical protein A3738_06465 [Oleiphilus sp. HI0066]KZY73852.1 hypothetical protein A3739_15000 [Oleiphilus sp. HI0067]
MKQSGFTLIELMLALVVAGIVAVIALPSFGNLIARNQISATANNVVGALNLARAEAAQRGRVVQVNSLDVGTPTNWTSGYRIWVDLDGDAIFDANEEIRRFDAIDGALTLTGTAGTFSFNGAGFATPAISFNLCTAQAGLDDRQIAVALSGRVNVNNFTCP